MEMCTTESNFFWKNPLDKNDQKIGKNEQQLFFFLLFRKIKSLVLSGNEVEWKNLWPFSILHTLYKRKKSSSQVMAKNALCQSDFSILFNYHYLVNGLTSDCDIFHVDGQEWTWQVLLMCFLKKNIFWGKWAILGLKMVHPRTLDLC